MPCLDMQNGRVVKGVHFVDIQDAGDPAACARAYCAAGADELAMLDITATVEHRGTLLEVVKRVAAVATVPFTVGGGIRTTDDFRKILKTGADKIGVNTAAVNNPDLIRQGAEMFGAQCVVLAVDARRKEDGSWEVYTHGGRTPTGLDAIEWAKRGEELGAGEILLTSMDCDGTLNGYDIELTRTVAESVSIPVIASGGAGTLDHIYDALTDGKAEAALVASIVHFRTFTIRQIKEYLSERGVPVRMVW